jgi:hypothetical protein
MKRCASSVDQERKSEKFMLLSLFLLCREKARGKSQKKDTFSATIGSKTLFDRKKYRFLGINIIYFQLLPQKHPCSVSLLFLSLLRAVRTKATD